MERKPCPVCLEVSLFENVSYRINPGIPVEKLGAFANSNIGICAACGTGQASPPFKSDELREFYSNLFSDASPTSRLMKRGVYSRTAHQYLTFKDFLNIKRSAVIEIGSNDTGWFKLCKLYGAKSYSYFDSVRSEHIDQRGGEFLGFLNSQTLSAVEACTVDLVVASHSVEHLIPEEIMELLVGLNRVLKPKTGKLYIEIPLELGYFDARTLTPPHTLFFTMDGLIKLLDVSGFNLIGSHVIYGHKYGTYKSAEESFFKRALNFLFMKILLPERIFPDSIVNLSSNFYPPSKFDYLRILVQKR
jgi:hypothetical protein